MRDSGILMNDLKLKAPLIIGRGPWSRTLERVVHELGGATAGGVGREFAEQAMRTARTHHDCVIVASALPSHFELAKAAMQQRLPLFIEKPLCASWDEAQRLHDIWVLMDFPPVMVDFTYSWCRAFERLQQLTLGKKVSITGKFGGPGPLRPECHPVWDYGCHVLAMAELLHNTNTSDLKLLERGPKKWTLIGGDITLHVDVGLEVRVRSLYFSVRGEPIASLRGTSWRVGGEIMDDGKDPPLQRALRAFLNLDMTGNTHWDLNIAMRVQHVLHDLMPDPRWKPNG